MSESVKPCKKCGEIERNKRGNCVACVRKNDAEWRKNNPQKLSQMRRRYYEGNKDRMLTRQREYYRENTEKFRESEKRRKSANPEKYLEIQRKSAKKWNENNIDKKREHARNWLAAHPEKNRAATQARRALVKKNGGTLSKGIVAELLERQKGKCACCGISLDAGYHLDHIMPLALGGTNTDDNVQLLAPRCNLSKGAKHPIDYMRQKGLLL